MDAVADVTTSERETQDSADGEAEAAPAAAPCSTTTLPADGPVDADADTETDMEIQSSAAADFNIVLYGASSDAKHRVVQRVLEKLMAATECGFSSLPQIDVPQNIRALITAGRSAQSHCIISIVDRTENALSKSGKWVGRFTNHCGKLTSSQYSRVLLSLQSGLLWLSYSFRLPT